MRQRTSLILALTMALALAALFGAAPFAVGSPLGQQDLTDTQATIDALVQERFTQTAAAAGPVLTATAEAGLTLTADAQATQGAAIALTVDAAFYEALTATAAPQTDPIEVTAAATAEVAGYRIELAPVNAVEPQTLQLTAQTVDRRLEALDVPAVVTVSDVNTIQVELAAPDDLEETLTSIQEAGLLEFVDFSGQLDRIDELLNAVIVTTAEPVREGGVTHPDTGEPFATVVTGADVANATAVELEGDWGVRFEFTDAGGQRMVEFTGASVGEPLAILIDGHVLSTPIIQGEFGAEGGLLRGGFSQEEAERLALQLNFGALPVGLEVVATEPLAALPNDVAVIPTPTAVPTSIPASTPTPDPRPTATTGDIAVVEEVFERGRMFYIQPLDQIWVMEVTGEGRGEWSIYPDTFEEGEPEFDPSIVPPEDLYQPERGFGKLWRDNPEVREALGWAVTPEFGYTSEYRYQPGGEIVDGQVVPGPGYHVLFSLYGEAFQFNEVDNSWQFHGTD